VQFPPKQLKPAGHWASQAPQFCASVLMLAQPLLGQQMKSGPASTSQ